MRALFLLLLHHKRCIKGPFRIVLSFSLGWILLSSLPTFNKAIFNYIQVPTLRMGSYSEYVRRTVQYKGIPTTYGTTASYNLRVFFIFILSFNKKLLFVKNIPLIYSVEYGYIVACNALLLHILYFIQNNYLIFCVRTHDKEQTDGNFYSATTKVFNFCAARHNLFWETHRERRRGFRQKEKEGWKFATKKYMAWRVEPSMHPSPADCTQHVGRG